MCDGILCKNCAERYECKYYQASIGFGEYNVEVDLKNTNKKPTKEMTLDYYDKRR